MTVKEYNNFYGKCENAINFIRNLRKITNKFSTSTEVATEFDIFGFNKDMEDLIVKAISGYCENKKSKIDKNDIDK